MQHFSDGDGLRPFDKPRAVVTAHENNRNIQSTAPDFALEIRAADPRHRLVGQDKMNFRIHAEQNQISPKSGG
jgi:hypothetical protein